METVRIGMTDSTFFDLTEFNSLVLIMMVVVGGSFFKSWTRIRFGILVFAF